MASIIYIKIKVSPQNCGNVNILHFYVGMCPELPYLISDYRNRSAHFKNDFLCH